MQVREHEQEQEHEQEYAEPNFIEPEYAEPAFIEFDYEQEQRKKLEKTVHKKKIKHKNKGTQTDAILIII